jgi:glycerol-3-phosphate dehydrogenase
VDLLVVGGGIVGGAIARDAALRGLSVALIEKRDFGSGTTAASTRLIHGGLRYLEIFDFGLVRESLRERQVLLNTAPHLVRPLLFLAPVYRTSPWSPSRLRLGLTLYDLLSWGRSVPSHQWLSRDRVLQEEPGLDPAGLLGGGTYYDAQVDLPERLCLEYVLQAFDQGAWVANYARAERFLKEGSAVAGVQATDLESGAPWELRAEITVNAAGPWADDLAERASTRDHRLRLTKGVHLVMPSFTQHAVVLRARSDGRLFFAVPWLGYTLLGTTDTDYRGDLDHVPTAEEDARYLLAEASHAFPNLGRLGVNSATAGLRALVPSRAAEESATSRKDRVVDHAAEGVPGLISVLGGKITAARHIAERVVDLACRKLGRGSSPCRTHVTPTHYGTAPKGRPDSCQGSLYGARQALIERMALADPDLARPLLKGEPVLWAQVDFGVRYEGVRTAADLLLRRTALGYRDGHALEVAGAVAGRIAALLGRDEAAAEADFRAYQEAVERLEPQAKGWGGEEVKR